MMNLVLCLLQLGTAWSAPATPPVADPRVEVAGRAADAAMTRLQSLLMEKMESGKNPHQAIPFCHTSALPVTKEEVSGQILEIRRATFKPRNAENKANERESVILTRWEKLLREKKSLPAFETEDEAGKLHYFRPIRVGGLCLKCHGPAQGLEAKVKEELARSYPQDQAVGYAAGDLRGMLHVVVRARE